MGKKTALEVEGRSLQVSNLEKVMYPATGFTKAQVIDYYIRASSWLLPHLKNRPFTLKRYPDGVTGEHFYEKNAPRHTPDWVKTFPVPRKGRQGDIHYVTINDLPTLVWAANLASLELHVLLARAPKIYQPTAVVFDLDPGEPADVLDCARVAMWVRDLLEALKLKSFVKSSGSKGLQLYVPLNTSATYEKTQPFARGIAQCLQELHPERVVAGMAKKLRGGKVFIDWSQNTEHKTTVCVYSLRAKRERPFVSMPFRWEEVEEACHEQNASAFFLEAGDALARLEREGDLFEPVLKLKQRIPANYEKKLAAFEPTEPKPPAKKSKPRLKGAGDRSLKAYEAKRDFTQTEEPAPAKSKARRPAASGPLFVIQKHQARNLHYDFRLEIDGVLKSWAVPKGPPYARAERRLAMHVEDHPMDYARFEGTIAPGNYGAGTVMVWDIGTFEVMDGNIHQGKLHLMLRGKKLDGEWILVRGRKSDDGKQPWFLIKGGDSMDAPPGDLSALTGRTMDEITGGDDPQWESNRKASNRSRRALAAAH